MLCQVYLGIQERIYILCIVEVHEVVPVTTIVEVQERVVVMIVEVHEVVPVLEAEAEVVPAVMAMAIVMAIVMAMAMVEEV